MLRRPGLLAKFAGLCLVFFILLGAVRSIDALSFETDKPAAPPPRREDRPRLVQHTGSGRTFILLVDSLRYATALDASVMPHLVALRERSTYGKTLSCRDAVTVSALRAAFTGRDGFSVLGFVENFWRGDAQIDSLFVQTQRSGIPTLLSSDGSFDQFGLENGDRFHHELGEGTDQVVQEAAVRSLLEDDYLPGHHDFIVAHITYADMAAHRYGVGAPEYRAAFAGVDGLIQRIDEAIDPADTLVVMGDHGHDLEGRHALGLDVPTFSLYRGPGFRRGLDLGTLSITEHRYLTSWSLGLPLDAGYSGARHPNALVSGAHTPTPDFQAAVAVSFAGDHVESTPLSARQRWDFIGTLLYLALLLGVLVVVALRFDEDALDWKQVGSFVPKADRSSRWSFPALGWALIAASGVWMTGLRPLSSLFGCGAAIGWLCVYAPRATSPRNLARSLPILAGLAGAFGLFGWGYFLAAERVHVHEPELGLLQSIWRGVIVCGAVGSFFLRPTRVAWGLFAAAGLLLYPTIYRYGFVGSTAILWFSFLLFVCLDWQLRRRPRATLENGATLALGLVAMLLLLPFFFPKSGNFQFYEWDGALAIHDKRVLLGLAAAARTIVLLRHASRRTLGATLVGLALAILLLCSDLGLTPLANRFGAVLAVSLGVASVLSARVELRRAVAPGSTLASGLTRSLRLGALFVAWTALIRVAPEVRATGAILLGVLSLSVPFVSKVVPAKDLLGARLLLLMLGLLSAGWGTLAFTTHRLEWAFLYDWLSHATVEHHVGLFTPLMLARYMAPVLIARILVEESLHSSEERHALTSAGLRVVGAKLAALAFVLAGIGYYSPLTNVYLEAVEEAAIFFVLALGLTLDLSARRPAHAAAPEGVPTLARSA